MTIARLKTCLLALCLCAMAASGAQAGAIAGGAGLGLVLGGAAGAAGGYLYSKHKEGEQKSFQRGYDEGRRSNKRPPEKETGMKP